MRLIHTISARDVFGPEKTVINECLALREDGWDCRIVNIWESPDVPISAKIAAAGIPYECIATHGRLDFAAIRTLAQRLRGRSKPLVHSHGYKADTYSLLAARLAGAPVVTTAHGWTSENRKVRMYENLQAFMWRYFDQVICVSESYRQTAQRTGVALRKLVVVHNGIPASYRHGDVELRRRVRADLGLSESQIAVASVGRLGIEKGHQLFVDAAVRLVPSHPQARFFIVGDGAERDNIVAQIRYHGIEDYVTMLGHRDDLRALYHGFDVLAISSLREGLPNVLLEAMLNGIPAVAMAVGGIPEVIEDRHDGLLVEPGNLSHFVDSLARMLADPAERQRMGDAARITVTKRFLFEMRMEKVIRIYLARGPKRC